MSYGLHQYRRSESSAFSPREAEATAFAFVNRMLQEPENRMRGLVKNQQLWSLLLKDVGATGNGLHDILKSDLIALGRRVLLQTVRAMGRPEMSLQELIAINDDMVAGLRSQPAPAARPDQIGLALAG